MPTESDWERYGRVLHRAMAELPAEFPEEAGNSAERDAGLGRSPAATMGS